MASILYIEDDREISKWVIDVLKEKGHDVFWLSSGEGAMEKLSGVDIAILDVMLPGLDGFSVGRRLKAEVPDLPILMLSARTSVEDRLQGLEFADDYLTKPFYPEELAARIDVLLRRTQRYRPEKIELGHLIVYPAENRIVDHEKEKEIFLTGKQHQIFHFLLQHSNQILTKEQLYEGIWKESYLDGDKTLMVHIRYLREKIEKDPANPVIIETIRGLGYRIRL
ncbi:response regulator transcription factor [Lederbergia lenta]|uniref:Transcriptional regulatory protein yvrH n=1 Tax=Lederbergia lenta TaxID=1467 RepID=A0A2X4ZEW0_LEDLE|nr:response regulator transcription factor [Lederbergia lenta]MCM3112118.1 response regulator transcription factor [Lederbergia lenta]MEC2323288.1 response regulator transcription factor [Lederbergia lenta]SQI63145.1 transcriptional regulatory protein yvrH [Lederbergia lenta]